MTVSRSKQSYRNRRIYQALVGGEKRTGKKLTKRQRDKLRRDLGKIWDAGINQLCFLCQERKLTPSTSAFCHNIALAVGGLHHGSNIFLACGRCNRSQRTLSVKDYLKLQEVVRRELGETIWKLVRRWLAGSRY